MLPITSIIRSLALSYVFLRVFSDQWANDESGRREAHMIVSTDAVPPEGFVYQFMKSMAEALAWMHHGVWDWRKIDKEPPKEDWVPWMHNDIKPDNGKRFGEKVL